VRLVVLLRDRPGALARLTAVVAEERANVVHIEHDRAFARWSAIGETEVVVTLETSGRDHVERLLARLRAAGYRVDEEGA
jgi:threonine dehydratase